MFIVHMYICEMFSFLVIHMNNLIKTAIYNTVYSFLLFFYRRFRNSEVDYRTGDVYISASSRKCKHKYSDWNSTGHAATKKWKCSFTQVKIALWIFLSPCKDVPWPEQKCLMRYLGLCKENRHSLTVFILLIPHFPNTDSSL